MTTEQIEIMKRAAANRRIWGRFASLRYATSRGVPMWAYRLACQLHATSGPEK